MLITISLVLTSIGNVTRLFVLEPSCPMVPSITSVDNAAWPALVPAGILGRGVYFRFNSDQEKREFVVEGVFYVAIQTTSWFEPCMTNKLILRPSLL